VDRDLTGLAFSAGLVAALNPCGFAMLPAYLALVVRGEKRGHVAAVGRAIAATAVMALGFVVVFSAFGLLAVSVASTVQRYLPYVTVLIGAALVVLGGWLLAGRELRVLIPQPLAHNTRLAPTARLGSMLGYGVGYAIASLSCTIGPFLAVTAAGSQGQSVLRAMSIYLAYSAGFVLIVAALAVAAALASSALVSAMHRMLPYINRIGGALLVIVGLYVGYYGFYEVRLFTAGGNPQDPVIAAAGRIQGALAGWVHRHGAWPWLLLSLVLVIAVVGWSWRARGRGRVSAPAGSRSSPSGRATADDGP
jgi:cytochrome c biogenesis protein CcdA